MESKDNKRIRLEMDEIYKKMSEVVRKREEEKQMELEFFKKIVDESYDIGD